MKTLGILLFFLPTLILGETHGPESARPTFDPTAPYQLSNDDANSVYGALLLSEVIKPLKPASLTGEMTCTSLVGPDGKLVMMNAARCQMKIGDRTIHVGEENFPTRMVARFTSPPYEVGTHPFVTFDYEFKTTGELGKCQMVVTRVHSGNLE